MDEVMEMSTQTIEEQTTAVTQEGSYQQTEPLLWALLKKLPNNTEPEDIAAKVLLIDRLYSTQLFLYKKTTFLRDIVENIRTIPEFDERVKNGDPDIVSAIYRGLPKNLFSFATKYCCLHNAMVYGRDDYSIYDSTVHKLLPKYAKTFGVPLTGVQIEEWRRESNYAAFNAAVDAVLDSAGVRMAGRKRKFDLFLWSQR